MLADSERQGYVRLILQGRDGHEVTFCREIVPSGEHHHSLRQAAFRSLAGNAAVQDDERQGYVRLILQGRDSHEVTFCREIVPTGA